MTKNIRQITRTLISSDLDGTESFAGRDGTGDFQIAKNQIVTTPYYNFMYNPDANIDQDGFSGGTPVNGEYTLDMFKTYLSSGGNEPTWKVYRDTANLETDDISESSLKIEITAAGTASAGEYAALYFPFPEWDNKYRGDTFSFALRAEVESGETVQLAVSDGVDTTYEPIVGTGSNVDYHFTHTLNASATQLYAYIYIHRDTVVSAGIGDYYFKQMRLYKGVDYKPYQPRGKGNDLTKCMGVYQKTFPYGQEPAAGVVTNYIYTGALTATRLQIDPEFILQMISIPSVVLWGADAGATANTVYNASTAANVAALVSNAGEQRGVCLVTGTMTAGDLILYHWVADARL